MDFAAGLANLEQTASSAQKRGRPRDDNNNNNSNNNDDDRRYQSRPRHNNTNYSGGGRGGRGYNNYSHRHDNHHHHHYPTTTTTSSTGKKVPDRDLAALKSFGYRVPCDSYVRPPPIPANSQRPLHICLLAITIDDLPYEAIWRAWAANVGASTSTGNDGNSSSSSNSKYKVSLLCHAKYPDNVQSSWLKQRMLLQPRRIVRGNLLSEPEYLSHRPGWGSIEITRAMIDLLVEGMEIGQQQHHQQQRRGQDEDHDADASNSNSNNKNDTDPRFSPHRFWVSSDDYENNNPKSVEQLFQEDIPPVDKFIFISETCVPVTTLEECGRALFKTTIQTRPVFTESFLYAQSAEENAINNGNKEYGKIGREENAKEGERKMTASNKQEEEEEEEKKSNKYAAKLENGDNEDNDKVIYLDTSWVNARNFNSPNTPQNKYERDQFSMIHRIIPQRFRWKADQWMVLSRTHASAVLDLDHFSSSNNKFTSENHLWNNFRRINASDEMYFPTTLALAKVLRDTTRIESQWKPPPPPPHKNDENTTQKPQEQPQTQETPAVSTVSSSSSNLTPWLERRKVTYTDWSVGMRNPALFTNGIKDFVNIARLARQQQCLFARKFSPLDLASQNRTGDISVEEWTKEMEILTKQQKERQP